MKTIYALAIVAMVGFCSSASAQLYVNFNVNQATQLVASAGTDHNVCRVDTVQLGGSPSASGGTAGYQYSWSTSGAISSTTDPNPVGNCNVTTDFILTVTDTNNCTSIDTATVNISPCASVQEWTLPIEVSVAPNPSNGQFNIALTGNYGKAINLDLRNSLGQVVRKKRIGKVYGTANVVMDISDQGPGVYTVDLSSNRQHSIYKVIVH